MTHTQYILTDDQNAPPRVPQMLPAAMTILARFNPFDEAARLGDDTSSAMRRRRYFRMSVPGEEKERERQEER